MIFCKGAARIAAKKRGIHILLDASGYQSAGGGLRAAEERFFVRERTDALCYVDEKSLPLHRPLCAAKPRAKGDASNGS
ncbi:MAG: hypothetical protein ACOX83_10255 [Candidatus Spyradocola sp.]